MKLYHQTGHNYVWNIDSYNEDRTGDGLILSPVNLTAEKVSQLAPLIRRESIFDPQFYMPKEQKGKLVTYPFFPANVMSGLATSDLDELSPALAEECVRFQLKNDFEYVVVPARYYDAWPTDYYEKLQVGLLEPFVAAVRKYQPQKPILQTLVVKSIQITDQQQRHELLNWITGRNGIDGVYVIFEDSAPSKQIKDPMLLAGALQFIHGLKLNRMQVVVGYCNTEGLLYSVAGPDAVATGAYENVRSFAKQRFQEREREFQGGPNPRIYSGHLLQWIEHAYLAPIQTLVPEWQSYFEESRFQPLMFTPEFKWHFTKPELYKHHFVVFDAQVRALPASLEHRLSHVVSLAEEALERFDRIRAAGVYLDGDSDGSHLPHWLNAMALYRRYLQDLGL